MRLEDCQMTEDKMDLQIFFEYTRKYTKDEAKLKEILNNFPFPKPAIPPANPKPAITEKKGSSNDKYGPIFKPSGIFEYSVDTNPFYTNEMLPELVDKKLIKGVTADVPDGILPTGYSCTLTDYRPKTRKNDEVMYSKEEVLRLMVPRGDCKMELKMPNGSKMSDIVIYGQNKFSGSTFADEDDYPEGVVPAPNKFFLKNPEKHTHTVIASEKINGEAAHFGGRFIDGQFYLFAGSKNVHMMFQNEEHISLYEADRYRIANGISKAVLEYWKSFDKETRDALAIVLHLTRITIIGELKMHDHQHVVYFKDLKRYELILFSIASAPPTTRENKSFTALPTVSGLDFLKRCGFLVAHVQKIPLKDLERNKEEVRGLINEEGRVYYFEDIEGNTIGLLKHKSLYYVHLRALRQQATYRHRISGNDDKKKTLNVAKEKARKRLDEIQIWLKTTDKELEAWKDISDEWFNWLEKNISKSDSNKVVNPYNLRENFPTVWTPFLKELKEKCSKISESIKLLKLTKVLD